MLFASVTWINSRSWEKNKHNSRNNTQIHIIEMTLYSPPLKDVQTARMCKLIWTFTVRICLKTRVRMPLSQHFHPFMPNELFYNHSMHRSISNIRGVWLVLYYYHVLYKFVFLMQIVQTLIRRRVLRRPIWVYIVCQCPFYGTLGSNALKHVKYQIGHINN